MSRSVWLGVLLFTTATASAQTEVLDKLKAGDEALARFDLSQATIAYRDALNADATNYEAHWKLARALIDQATLESDFANQKNLYREAQDLARTAVQLNPNNSKGHTFLAIGVGKLALFYGGRTKVELSNEVKIEAEKAAGLNPNEDLAYHVLGVWNREMAELNWMLKKFAEILYGRFPPASIDDALKDLRKASELAPNVVAHPVELGITLATARQWSEAKSTLDHALAMTNSWVTDDYYKDLAKRKLEAVKTHRN
ncbi:MAG TPA: hypothetical protein VLZ12_10520 [Verrucomicrobiae bacterium]|nr:hypothetical protein [Verrucomicrobiae bacterium]